MRRLTALLLVLSMLLTLLPASAAGEQAGEGSFTGDTALMPLNTPNDGDSPSPAPNTIIAAAGTPVYEDGSTAHFTLVASDGKVTGTKIVPSFRQQAETTEGSVTYKCQPQVTLSDFHTQISASDLKTGSAPGSFYLKQGNTYVYFKPGATSNTWIETGDPNRNPADCSVLLFKANNSDADATKDNPLKGYERVNSVAEGSNDNYIVAALRNERLYLLNMNTNAVTEVQSQITVTINSPATKSYAFRVAGVACTAVVLGTIPGAPTPADREKDITLNTAYDPSVDVTDDSGAYTSAPTPVPNDTTVTPVDGKTNQYSIKKSGTEIAKMTINASEGRPNVKVGKYADGAYTDEGEDLSACLYQFVQTADSQPSYYVVANSATNNTAHPQVYLNIAHMRDNNTQGFPNQDTPDKICFTFGSEGECTVSNTTGGELKYSKWNFFTSKAGAVDDSYTFLIYRAEVKNENLTYHQVMTADELQDGGRYLITATKDRRSYMVLRPVYASGEDRNAGTARIPNEDFHTSTEIVFDGTTQYDGTASVKLGSTTYNIKVVGQLSDYRVTHKELQNTTFSVIKDNEKLVQNVFGFFKENNLTLNGHTSVMHTTGNALTLSGTLSDSNMTIYWTSISRPESYASHHDGSNNGTAEHYNGTEAELKECLYTAQKSGEDFTFRHNGIYLSTARDGVTGISTPEVIFLERLNNDCFALKGENNNYLAFRRNGWGVFFAKSAIDATGNGYTPADCEFSLYTPVTAAELESSATQNGNLPGSNELPGYKRITNLSEIQSGRSYLITAFYAGNIYVLYPSTSGNRNYQVVMANKLWTSGETEMTIVGKKQDSRSDLVFGKLGTDIPPVTFTIQVVSPLNATHLSGTLTSLTGQANNRSISRLTLSAGKTYTVMDVSDAQWMSNNDKVATVEKRGDQVVITAVGTDGNYEGKTVVGYRKDGTETAIEVTVLSAPASGSTRLVNMYFENVENTEVWYTFAKASGSYTAGDFHQIQHGEAIYFDVDATQPTGLDMFARAKDGYVLTMMGSTNGNDHSSIVANASGEAVDRAENTYFYTRDAAAVKNQISAFTPISGLESAQNSMKNMIQYAMDHLRCTGAHGFTKWADQGGSIYSTMTYRSDPLPTVQKKVLAITRVGGDKEQYTDGAAVSKNDVVHFMVTVSVAGVSGTEDKITFQSVQLKDELANATFSGYQVQYGTDTPSNPVAFEGENDVYTDGDSAVSGEADLVRWTEGDYSYIDLTNLLNRHQNEQRNKTLTLKLFVNYTVTDADVTHIGNNQCLENNVTLSSEYKTKYDLNNKQNSDKARAILTIKSEEHLAYVNLTLSGSVGVNVYVKDYSHWVEGFSLVAEVNGKRTVTRFSDAEEAIIPTSDTENPLSCKKFTVNVAPQCMATPISLYIQDSKGGRVSEIITLKVQDYAKYVLTDSNKENLIYSWQINGKQSVAMAVENYDKLKGLVVSMLNYGTAVQSYLNYETSNLANSVLSDAEKTLPDMDWTGGQPWQTEYTGIAEQNAKIRFTGLALQLDSGAISMRVYFEKSDDITMEELHGASSYISQGVSGTYYQYTFTETVKSEVTLTGVTPYIRLNNITSNFLDSAYQITIRYPGGAAKLTLQPLAYAYLINEMPDNPDNEENRKIKDVAKAMVAYSQASNAYMGKTQNPGSSNG